MRNRVVAVLLVVALFIGAGAGFFIGSSSQHTATTTLVTTSRNTIASGPYTLAFRQRGVCSPIMWMLPWAITLDNTTEKVQPPTASIPPAYYYGTNNESLSTIGFSVGNGTYQWKSFPPSGYGDPSSGNVTIAGSDAVIQVDGFPTGCIITTTSTVSTATVQAGPVLYTSSVSSDGLQLQVALNSSTAGPKGEVTVHIKVLNTLNRNVSLGVVTNENISAWDGTDFFCGENPSYSLVGFGVFSGHFTAENISKAGSPLQLAAPIEAPCPYRLPLNDTTFLPNSDKTISFNYYGQTQEPSLPVTAEVNATTGYCTSSPSGTETSVSCATTPGLLGYWVPGATNAGNFTLAAKGFAYFPPGEYTIVATDNWNQNIYATFDVL